MHDERVERPTSKQGASKVTKILMALIANDRDVWFKCQLPSVVQFTWTIESKKINL